MQMQEVGIAPPSFPLFLSYQGLGHSRHVFYHWPTPLPRSGHFAAVCKMSVLNKMAVCLSGSCSGPLKSLMISGDSFDFHHWSTWCNGSTRVEARDAVVCL